MWNMLLHVDELYMNLLMQLPTYISHIPKINSLSTGLGSYI